MLIPAAILDYAWQHTTPLPPLLEELLATTRERLGRRAVWANRPSEAWLLHMLTRAMGARRVLELGTFTGLSTLMLAAALPDDGEVVTCELDPEYLAIAQSFFARSPHGYKIKVCHGPALETLKTMADTFDMVFVDADKENYITYYEAVLPLLSSTGIIVVDNVLWRGRVLQPETSEDHAILAFANHVQYDPRVVNTLLTTGDGVMLIQRLPPEVVAEQ